MQVLQQGISNTGAPYSYGFAIILLTIIVKAATFPLTQKQVSGYDRHIFGYLYWLILHS